MGVFLMSSKSSPTYSYMAGMIPPRYGRKENISTEGYLSQQTNVWNAASMSQTRKCIHTCIMPGSTNIQGYFQPDIQSAFDLFVSKAIALAMTALKINTLWVKLLESRSGQQNACGNEQRLGRSCVMVFRWWSITHFTSWHPAIAKC